MTETLETTDEDSLARRLSELAHAEVDVDRLRDESDFYQLRRDVFAFAENFKPNAAGEYSGLYFDLIEDSLLSEREAQVAVMKLAGLTHAAIVLFYEIMDSETKESTFPTSTATINEYSQRAREKYRRAVATINLLKPVYGSQELWECPYCEERTATPETDQRANGLKITCPSCGESEFQDKPSMGA